MSVVDANKKGSVRRQTRPSAKAFLDAVSIKRPAADDDAQPSPAEPIEIVEPTGRGNDNGQVAPAAKPHGHCDPIIVPDDECGDFITVLCTPDNSTANKTIRIKKEEIVVSAAGDKGKYIARTVHVPTLTKLKEIKQQLTSSMLLILGHIPGTKDGKPYFIMSQKRLNKALGKDEDNRPSGMYTIDGYEAPVAARLKENFQFSRIRVFDVDASEHTPEDQRYPDFKSWRAAAIRVCPELADVELLVSPSTKGQILDADGCKVFSGSSSMHVFFQIPRDDPPDHWAGTLLMRTADAGLTYDHPIFDKKTGKQIRTALRPSIYDRTAIPGPNRLLFEGPPKLTTSAKKAGLTLKDPELIHFLGGEWDTHKMGTPDDAARERFKERTGLTYTPNKRGGFKHFARDDLTLDMVIITKKGEMTVHEFWKSDHQKLRAQADWRGSTSWNAFLGRHKDGSPFFYDNGVHEKWTLPADVEEKFIADRIATFCDKVYAGEGMFDWAAVKDLAARGVKLQMETEALMEVFRRLKKGHRVHADLREVCKYIRELKTQAVGDNEAWMKEVLARFNAQHAVVHVGGKSLIMTEAADDFVLSKRSDFLEVRYAHDRVSAQRWLSSCDRREYSEIIFDPARPGHHGGKYNLFSGFGVRPVEGDCSLFKVFVKGVICDGDEVSFDYLWKWMADMIQKPGEKPGVSIVLRGLQGTGKGTFCGVLGTLVGRKAYMEVASMGRITGNFNAHMKNALLVNANEALWGGNKSHEGALKALVTDEQLAIEPKGVDTFFIKNCIRLIVTSNEAWAVPMGLDDRRFYCLDVPAKVKEDTSYFGAIHEQVENGGYEALMYELMQVDLTNFDVRTKPQTNAGHDMKLLSGSPVEQWWYDALSVNGFDVRVYSYNYFYTLRPGNEHDAGIFMAGASMVLDENGTRYFNKDKLAEVIQESRYFKRGWGIMNKDVVLKDLKKLVTYQTKRLQRGGDRCRVLIFPSLEECRRQWDLRVKRVDHEWEEGSTLRVDPEGGPGGGGWTTGNVSLAQLGPPGPPYPPSLRSI